MTVKAFISYKREDESFARELREKILSWGHQVWLDVVDIPAGTTLKGKGWDDAVYNGMKESQAVVGVMTPESVKSENVRDEWAWALEAKRRLFMLSLRDVPVEDIPPRYIRIQRIDVQKNRDLGLRKLQQAFETDSLIIPREKSQFTPVSDGSLDQARLHDETRTMLQKVEDFWITGVLEKSLSESRELDIGIRTGEVVLKHKDYGDYQLPENASPSRVFEDMDSELLILGAPGAGKTIWLLRLARELIACAKERHHHKIPVIFNLSSWAVNRLRFDDWLVSELRHKYQIQAEVARRWVNNNLILYLLDGLDEVEEQHRDECVAAIHKFREDNHAKHHTIEFAVCSRIVEYEALTDKLIMAGAITLQPLTDEQIDGYLAADDELSGLREIMEFDANLQRLAQTPYMLVSMAFAYRGEKAKALRLPVAKDNEAGRRLDILNTYVARKFEKTPINKKYSPPVARHYLMWLAKKLGEHKQKVFHIESMQPDWITSRIHRRAYESAIRLAVILAMAIPFIPVWILDYSSQRGLIIGIVVALVCTSAVAAMIWSALRHVFTLRRTLLVAILAGAGSGLAWGLPAGVTLGVVLAVAWRLADRLLDVKSGKEQDDIEIVDMVRLDLKRGVLGFLIGGSIGMLTGLVGAHVGTAMGPFWGLIFGLAFAARSGLVGDDKVEIRASPNEGIWRSARNALRLAVTSGVVLAPVIGLLQSLRRGWFWGSMYGLTALLIGGLIAWLFYGGFAVVQHLALRFMLCRMGSIPLNYADFLDYACQTSLMRKIGGGYMFAHRYLQEYFAELEA